MPTNVNSVTASTSQVNTDFFCVRQVRVAICEFMFARTVKAQSACYKQRKQNLGRN